MLHNKTLNDCSLGKHRFCFPQISSFDWNICFVSRYSQDTKQMFPWWAVIKCTFGQLMVEFLLWITPRSVTLLLFPTILLPQPKKVLNLICLNYKLFCRKKVSNLRYIGDSDNCPYTNLHNPSGIHSSWLYAAIKSSYWEKKVVELLHFTLKDQLEFWSHNGR